MRKRVGRPSIPSSDSTEEPKYLPTPTYRHTAPPLLKIQFSGGGENRKRAGWASGSVSARIRREESSSGAEGRGHWRVVRAERNRVGVGGARTPERQGAGTGPLSHLAALLVMKADHHDVQDGPPWGAIAAPPDLLHGRPPRARTAMTSTAKGGKLGDPAIPRRTARGGFQVSAREPHESRAGAGRRPRILQLCTALPGRGRASLIRFRCFRAVT